MHHHTISVLGMLQHAIWMTAQSPESVEAAVRRGFNVLTGGFGIPIERTAEFRRLFDRRSGMRVADRMARTGVHEVQQLGIDCERSLVSDTGI